ncbi:hypothetical protein AB4212_41035, partial [Streptomyces sp. 2MCAF27]
GRSRTILKGLTNPSAVGSSPTRSDDPPRFDSPVTLAEGTCQLLRALDHQLPAETAAWMCGFARLTAVIAAPWHSGSKRYVVGTPPYVEFAAE